MVGVLLRGVLPLFAFRSAKHRAAKHQAAKPSKNAISPWLHDTSSHPITEKPADCKKNIFRNCYVLRKETEGKKSQ